MSKKKPGLLISVEPKNRAQALLAAKMVGVKTIRTFLACSFSRIKHMDGQYRLNARLDPVKIGPTPEFRLAMPTGRSVGILPEFTFRYKAVQVLEYAMQLAEGDIDPSDGFPTAKWYKRAAHLVNAHDGTLDYNWTGIRNYIREVKTTRVVKAYWWIDRQLTIPEFRKRVFYPIYRDVIRDTNDFKRLQEAHRSGKNIVILSKGSRPFVDIQKHFNSRKPMGSATLLCAAIMEIEPIDREEHLRMKQEKEDQLRIKQEKKEE